MSSSRARLLALARRQFGVFTLDQARQAGVDPRTVRRWDRRGEVDLVRPRVWVLAGASPRREVAWMAALLHLGGEAVLARHTAAAALGLDVPEDGRVHLLVRSRSRTPSDLVVHRSSRLSPPDTQVLGALRVTSPARTICDLAGELDAATLRRLVAQAVRLGLTNADDLRRSMAWLGALRGAVALRAIVDELSPLVAASRSELEAEFVTLMTRAGLPPTAMNHRVTDARGRTRFLDAVYLPQRLPIELDGRASHGTLLDWNDDTRRENAVVLKGWRSFLRFSWNDVTKHSTSVVESVRAALAE